jgi:hypothetical protein
MRNQWNKKIIFLLLLVALLGVNFQQAFALEEGGFVKKEVDIVLNKSYEIFIGNGGVFLDNSRHIGTLVVKARKPVNRGWQVFTQRILDVRVYNTEGREFEEVYGLVRVYFNLDRWQRQIWENPTSNMSIWTFDDINGGWRKCYTNLVDSAQYPHGRLYCLVHKYGSYGLAWTKPTLKMQLAKAK